jgi:xanthine dehydrogenase iron-sulfur cluster and FAD-binding subunit A
MINFIGETFCSSSFLTPPPPSLSRRSLGPLCVKARVVYGGVSTKTFIAYRTEAVLTNSRVTSQLLQDALVALERDLNEIGISTAYGSAEYRYSVMQSCLYRSLLRCYKR